MAEDTSATCMSKKLEMKDAQETPALHSPLPRCLILSFFGPVSDLFSLIFGSHRGRCSIALPSCSLSFCSDSAPSFPAQDLDRHCFAATRTTQQCCQPVSVEQLDRLSALRWFSYPVLSPGSHRALEPTPRLAPRPLPGVLLSVRQRLQQHHSKASYGHPALQGPNWPYQF